MPGVENFEVFLAVLFVSVAGLNVLARWLTVPYPIPLVLGGLALGLVPGMPEIELEPGLVLVIFLPPLLYSAAFFSDLRALRSEPARRSRCSRSGWCSRRPAWSPCSGTR